jgi:hypothetical protein
VVLTIDEHVQAVADFGFTERQARFLVLVMRHAGVCVPRQYASFTGIANGGKTCNAFFDKLVRRGHAAAAHCVHNRARLYHVHHKALYYAIGEASSRYRRPVPARQASERLMLLDAVLTTPDVEWLTTGSEKAAYLASLQASPPPDTPRDAPAEHVSGKVSELSGTLPIGVDAVGRTALIYLATEPWTERFRSFLQAHTMLLRAARTWTIRLVFPRPLDRFYDAYQTVIRDELESPLHPATVSELKWFFEHRPQAGREPVHPQTQGFLDVAAKAFSTTRFSLLYRRWLQHGDVVLDGLTSAAIAEALNAGSGTIETVVLPHTYRHLSPLVAGDYEAPVRVEKGARRGDITPARPQPPPSTRSSISSTSALL